MVYNTVLDRDCVLEQGKNKLHLWLISPLLFKYFVVANRSSAACKSKRSSINTRTSNNTYPTSYDTGPTLLCNGADHTIDTLLSNFKERLLIVAFTTVRNVLLKS